jgi:hypothetical protein
MEALNKIRLAADNAIRERARKEAQRQVAGALTRARRRPTR